MTVVAISGRGCSSRGLVEVVRRSCRRLSSTSPADIAIRELAEHHAKVQRSPPLFSANKLNPNGVFTNSELRLSDMDVMGFDYDYTLAPYSRGLESTIFDMILDRLVALRHYPTALKSLKYDPGFLARGVHYDINKGIFLKVDAYHRISAETVHERMRKVPSSDLDRLYPGRRLFFGRSGGFVKQNVDIFELPQLSAWCSVLEYLHATSGDVHPAIVFEDINKVTYDIHVGGTLHGHIMANIGDYLESNPRLESMLGMLRDCGKQLFVLTNSPYNFIDSGMTQMIGKHWMELFDVVICLSKKPMFFNDTRRPFRRLSSNNEPTFGQVNNLKKGEVYCEGNVRDLHQFTGWDPCKILYFGDQMFADLAEPVLNQGWHTGAIIRELREEMELLNSAACQQSLFMLNELNYLINDVQQFIPHPSAIQLLDQWCTERKKVRLELLDQHPTKFGSIFRTHLTPTLFYRRLSRFAEIYTCDLTNLADFSPEHYRFTPIRQELPHELHCTSQLDICRAKCSWKDAQPWKECR